MFSVRGHRMGSRHADRRVISRASPLTTPLKSVDILTRHLPYLEGAGRLLAIWFLNRELTAIWCLVFQGSCPYRSHRSICFLQGYALSSPPRCRTVMVLVFTHQEIGTKASLTESAIPSGEKPSKKRFSITSPRVCRCTRSGE